MMATFKARKGLNDIVAKMIAPDIEDVAEKVEAECKKLAPPVKEWITMRDALVRPEHRKTDRQKVPANLRFDLPTHPWDREHRGLGPRSYLLEPRDESSRAVVNLINCRCRTEAHPEGVSSHIKAGKAEVSQAKVTAKVVCDAELCVDSEFGTVYPAGQISHGLRFMGRGAAQAAAASRGRR